MIQCLILVTIKNAELFSEYVNGHLPTIAKFGGRVVFRSTENSAVLGSDKRDVVVIQEWPSEEAFDLWWNSDEYKAWAGIRDKGAGMTILNCKNMMRGGSCNSGDMQ
jgi:uncharacterized protein (DUF1330 family)